ncbi:unnamed protein product [Didymodactylos carnosus]|uniref:Uncharacterized protein n=1 Tax=Didymodactylos carnosus TaxID=1234261 RepID=A0A813TYL8_9BILA|nr:unnamed protein product [Didymodactylos carnosus]CAF3607655.1 unnamed protein product [Didymodactylos carnosus]
MIFGPNEVKQSAIREEIANVSNNNECQAITSQLESQNERWKENLKRNVVEQAALLLLNHVNVSSTPDIITVQKDITETNDNNNNNWNAFSSCVDSLISKQHNYRIDKCSSWLSALQSNKIQTSSNPSFTSLCLNNGSLITTTYSDCLPATCKELVNRKTVVFDKSSSSLNSFTFNRYCNVSANAYIPERQAVIPQEERFQAPNDDGMTFRQRVLPEAEAHRQPVIMVHKKKLRRDYFLTSMQGCFQPTYSRNSFYAFDAFNMNKLRRGLRLEEQCDNDNEDIYRERDFNERRQSRRNLRIYQPSDSVDQSRDQRNKRKAERNIENCRPECICSEIQLRKKQHRETIGKKEHEKIMTELHQQEAECQLLECCSKSCVEVNKINYLPNENSPTTVARETSVTPSIKHKPNPGPLEGEITTTSPTRKTRTSQNMLMRLEKILGLCHELRTLAKDVETHVNVTNEQSDKSPNTQIQSCKSTTSSTKPNAANDEDCQSQIDIGEEVNIQTDVTSMSSARSSPPVPTTTATTKIPITRSPEDICLCFLQSFLQQAGQTECILSSNEELYLKELTRAYLLGKNGTWKELNKVCQKHRMENFIDNDEFVPSALQRTSWQSRQSVTTEPLFSINDDEIFINQQHNTKYQLFILEPMGSKPTTCIPGIGIKYSKLLANSGFLTARRLLGFYLMNKTNS